MKHHPVRGLDQRRNNLIVFFDDIRMLIFVITFKKELGIATIIKRKCFFP
jgi:hypothetical protein